MADNAVSIVREFVRAPEAQLRRNACVGLAALGGAEALELLVGLATEDEDASVRNWAARELSDLPPDELKTAEDLLVAALQRPRGSTWTYAAAARVMVSRDVRFAGLRPRTALRYAWRTTQVEIKGERWRQFWQAWGLLSVGMIVGWIAIAALDGILKTKAYAIALDTTAVVFFQVGLVLSLGVLASLRPIHWEGQARAGYASVLELCLTAVASASVAMIGAALVYANFTGKSEANLWVLAWAKLLLIGAAALTLARAVSLGLLRRTPYKGAWAAVRVLAACWAGAVFLILISFHKPDADLEPLYSPLFACALPLLLGSMLVFVFRDRSYAAKTAALGKPAFVITALLLAGSVVTVSYKALHTRMRPPAAVSPAHDQITVIVSPNSVSGADLIRESPITLKVYQDNMKVTASMAGAHRLYFYVNDNARTSDITDNPRVSEVVNRNDVVTITEAHEKAYSLLSKICKILGRPDPPNSGAIKLEWIPAPPKFVPPAYKPGNVR